MIRYIYSDIVAIVFVSPNPRVRLIPKKRALQSMYTA